MICPQRHSPLAISCRLRFRRPARDLQGHGRDPTSVEPRLFEPKSLRAMIECIFGWGKQHGTMHKTKHRGIAAVPADFLLNLIAYDLIRIPKLLAA